MRFSKQHKRFALGLAGVALIGLGGAGLLRAQRQPGMSILRLGPGSGAYLGITMEDVTAENMSRYKLTAETGVIVRSVEKGSPADAARLEADDVILEYAAIPVFSAAQFASLVEDTPVNRNVVLGILRDGKKMSVSVKTVERAEASNRLPQMGPNFRGRQFGDNALPFSVPRGSPKRLDDLLAPKPQLGIEGVTLTDQMASFLGVTGKKGVLVVSVTSGTPAAPVLRAGDVIVAVDSRAVSDITELGNVISGKVAGAKVELKVVRDKREMTLSVEFTKSPAQKGIEL